MIQNIKNTSGFTLVELLVSMALFGVIVSLIINAKIEQQGQSITQQQAAEMQQNIRAALYIMTRDIRMVGYDPEGTNGAGIVKNPAPTSSADPPESPTEDTLTFSMVADDGTLKTITYSLIGNEIKKDEGGGMQILAENITNLNFAYLDGNGGNLTIPIDQADIGDIRSIQITVTTSTVPNPLSHSTGNNDRTLTTTIKCRNLGL
jgi:type IV pilus assembly protein PilW